MLVQAGEWWKIKWFGKRRLVRVVKQLDKYAYLVNMDGKNHVVDINNFVRKVTA